MSDLSDFYSGLGLEIPDSLQGVTSGFDWDNIYQGADTGSSGVDWDGVYQGADTGSSGVDWDGVYQGSDPDAGSGGSGFWKGLVNLFNGSNPANKGLLQSMLSGLGGAYKEMNLKEMAQMGIDSNERRDAANNLTALERQKLINSGNIEGINLNNLSALERQKLANAGNMEGINANNTAAMARQAAQMEAVKQRQTDLNNSIQPTKWSV